MTRCGRGHVMGDQAQALGRCPACHFPRRRPISLPPIRSTEGTTR